MTEMSKLELLEKCKELGITKCSSKKKGELIDLINNAEPIAILTSVDDNSVSIGNFEKQMIQSRENICQSNSNLHLCLDTPAKRLLDNIPNIKNGEGDDDHGGYCRAYSDFIERVAYLGDFVGTDYHPNDGKYVGVDCDANHYPLPAKKI